jgi:hypothetical protein
VGEDDVGAVGEESRQVVYSSAHGVHPVNLRVGLESNCKLVVGDSVDLGRHQPPDHVEPPKSGQILAHLGQHQLGLASGNGLAD